MTQIYKYKMEQQYTCKMLQTEEKTSSSPNQNCSVSTDPTRNRDVVQKNICCQTFLNKSIFPVPCCVAPVQTLLCVQVNTHGEKPADLVPLGHPSDWSGGGAYACGRLTKPSNA